GNFKDDALEKILRYFERQAEMNLLVDNLALAQVGLTPDVKTTLSGVKDEPIWMALERLLDPLGLAYRAIDQQTLQITSRNALLEQFDLEAYKISDLVPDKFPLDDFLAKLQALIEPGSWGEFNPGAVVYDAQSGTMFVRHHQIAQGQIEDWLATIRAPVKKDAGANEPANAGGGQKPEPKTAAPKNTASKKVAP
ncbi:MAG TPA: hypothetical protein VGE52_11185, partial [Pirellulales bacterium]